MISAVGHEIDFTISDFVADLRAPTPSAAMELATPSREELFAFIDEFSYYFTQKIFEIIADYKVNISQIVTSHGFRLPQDSIKNKSQFLDSTIFRFQFSFDNNLINQKNQLDLLRTKMESFNINNILKRGFTIVEQDGKLVPRMKIFKNGTPLKIKFYDGEIGIKNG